MTIKIDIQKPEIDISIGGIKFIYDYSDDTLSKLQEKRVQIVEELRNVNLEDEDDIGAIDKLKDLLNKAFDMYLGDGAFDKVYAINQSSLVLAEVFAEIHESIERELEKRGARISASAKAEKYLRNKKKKQ